MLGWAGHAENFGTIGSVEEILKKVSDHKIENIFTSVWVWTRDGEAVDIPLDQLKASRVSYPNTCQSLALSSMLERKPIQQLLLFIGDLGNHSIQIHLKGNTLDIERNIREHIFQSTGDAINLNEKNVSVAYMVDISQRVFVEEDPTNTCRDYPNQEYLSYQECDDHFVKNLLPGLTPIWLTEDFAKVSKQASHGKYGEQLPVLCASIS